MSPFSIDNSTWFTALGSAFALGVVVGALPVGVAEAIAIGIGLIAPAPLSAGVLITFTAGHVLGKALWYWLGTLGSHVTQPYLRVWIDRARDVAERHPTLGLGVTASSAFASVPPFHLMAVAAGLLRAPALPFFSVAFAGRLLRFGLLAAFPAALRYLSLL